jgi:hypothetical protein
MIEFSRSIKNGVIKCAVWATEHEHNGRSFTRHSCTFTKSLYDPDTNAWRDVTPYNGDELQDVASLAQAADRFINIKERDPNELKDLDPAGEVE